MTGERVAVVLGARNLGGAIVDHLGTVGWRSAAVALSDETATAVNDRGALGIAADASSPEALEHALARVREELGDFVAAIEEVPELRELLRNPQVDPRARAAALDDVSRTSSPPSPEAHLPRRCAGIGPGPR